MLSTCYFCALMHKNSSKNRAKTVRGDNVFPTRSLYNEVITLHAASLKYTRTGRQVNNKISRKELGGDYLNEI